MLTKREEDVRRLMADGLSNREIGERLYLSTDTVKCHVKAIYRKLGAEPVQRQIIKVLRERLTDSGLRQAPH